MTNRLKQIGPIIAKIREERRITQKALASAIKTTQSAVARMEKGEQNLTTEMLARIGRALKAEILSVASGKMNLEIKGGKKLHGTITVNTSKNGAVCLLSASLLNRGTTLLKNMPNIEDVNRVIEVLQSIGVRVAWRGNDVEITPPKRLTLSKMNIRAATSTEKRAVIEATINAGAKNAYVIKEPILAAIGAGIPIHEARGHMIVDIGGGTIDVAVISLGGIVVSTSVKCAGNRIDQAITDYIKKTHNLAIGDKTAEDIKIQVGSAAPLEEELSMLVKGRDYVTGLPRTAEIKTNEIVRAINRELREMIKAIRDVLQETPPELSADIIDRGIIMTGGSSQLRHFPELVFRRTGVKAILAKDAQYCVAKGTGVALNHLDTYKKSIIAKR